MGRELNLLTRAFINHFTLLRRVRIDASLLVTPGFVNSSGSKLGFCSRI